jgi:hypothetical protein
MIRKTYYILQRRVFQSIFYAQENRYPSFVLLDQWFRLPFSMSILLTFNKAVLNYNF